MEARTNMESDRELLYTYIHNRLTHQIKHKLHNRRSNNQAEQMAIIKALKAIDTIKISNNTPLIIMIHTDSRSPLKT